MCTLTIFNCTLSHFILQPALDLQLNTTKTK